MGLSIKKFEPLVWDSFEELGDGAFFVCKEHLEDDNKKSAPLFLRIGECEDSAINLEGFYPRFEPIESVFDPDAQVVQVMIDLSLDLGDLVEEREPDDLSSFLRGFGGEDDDE